MVISVIPMPASFSRAQSSQSRECSSASPPLSTTRSTPRERSSGIQSATSSGSISSRFVTFQMSHITHRQLQRACG